MVNWLPALMTRLPSFDPTEDATWVTDWVASWLSLLDFA